MRRYKAYKKNDVILFDLNIINLTLDDEEPMYHFETNLPGELIDIACPNHIEVFMELEFNNVEKVNSFLEEVCRAIVKLPEAPYFYYPPNSKGRVLDGVEFVKKLRVFDIETIKSNTLYSINENIDEFYCISAGFSSQRLFDTESFEKENKSILRKEFEANLLPEFSEAYFEFYSDNNRYYTGIDVDNDNLKYFVLTDKDYFPLMFFYYEP